MEDDGNNISIGENTRITGTTQLAACEGTSIKIGKDCLFSHSIYIRTTDSHGIFDMNGNRINSASNIKIGNNVWIGMQAMVLKGSEIGNDVIVGARTIVTNKSPHENNITICGQPGKLIKSNVKWDINRKP